MDTNGIDTTQLVVDRDLMSPALFHPPKILLLLRTYKKINGEPIN
jgi:hypothetical protein